MIGRYSKYNVIANYIKVKLEEVQRFNIENNITDESLINGRSLTNIGTFRAYIEGYLRNHNKIHDEMTFLVDSYRQAQMDYPLRFMYFQMIPTG